MFRYAGIWQYKTIKILTTMKNLTTTTTQTVTESGPKVQSVLIHTATSCYLVDTVLCKVYGENAIDVAKIILAMHAAIQRAEQFMSGFEGDETQTGVEDTLEMLRQFDLKSL
jgi:hypothetical protein